MSMIFLPMPFQQLSVVPFSWTAPPTDRGVTTDFGRDKFVKGPLSRVSLPAAQFFTAYGRVSLVLHICDSLEVLHFKT